MLFCHMTAFFFFFLWMFTELGWPPDGLSVCGGRDPFHFSFLPFCVVLPTACIYIHTYYNVLLVMIISVLWFSYLFPPLLPPAPTPHQPVCLFLGLCFLFVLCGLLPGLLCYGYFHFWSQVGVPVGTFFPSPLMGSVYTVEISVSFTFFCDWGVGGQNTGDLRTIPLPFC